MLRAVKERKSRLGKRQQGRLLEYFVAGATARAAAGLVGVQPNTAIRFFMKLRKLIASKLPSYDLSGEVEADESYFGGVRKGKRGRGAAGKVALFGLLKRGGKVYTAIIPNESLNNGIMQTVWTKPPAWDKIHFDTIVRGFTKLFSDKMEGVTAFFRHPDVVYAT